ncbi:MAG: NHL repeat-containing protein [Dehalococcoidia bacterium]
MRRITSNPVDIAIGGEGCLFVICRGDSTTDIRRTNWDDEDLGTISGPGSADGKLLWPTALILDRDERLYVCDEATHRISIFGREGEFLGKWGEQGNGEGQFNRPSGIAFDPDENIYVADTLNHRIQKFRKGGRFLLAWGQFGSGDCELNMPWGIDVDDEGNVYVADWRNDRIQKFSAEGRPLLRFGISGSDNGQFNRPSGVTVDRDGDIYVADWGNNRVQLFNPEGRYVEQFIGDATLSRVGREYLRSNAKPMRLREMADLEPQKRLKAPVSVRVDDEGHLYIPDYGCHRIQIYQKQADRLEPDEIAPPLRSPTLITT